MFHRNRSRYLQIDLVGQSITRPMQKQKKMRRGAQILIGEAILNTLAPTSCGRLSTT